MNRVIAVNQGGYAPRGVKKATMNFPADCWEVKDQEGQTVLSGLTENHGFDAASGDNVWTADFSALCRPGTYVLCAGGVQSAHFTVDEQADRRVLDSLCKAYYWLRCGTELTAPYAGKFTHPVCHCGRAHLWNQPDGPELELTGGWHDAGDYGRYVTAGAVAVAQLLYAYRLWPECFDRQTLKIPESGSGMPDLLSECRWELEWMLKMQRDDGAVYHKLTTAQHAAFVMPQEDRNPLWVLPVSSMATADFAAVCALASDFYRASDDEFARRLREAAEKAGGWLLANPEFLPFRNPEGCGTGEYGEWQDTDNRFWAACELYKLTGRQEWLGLMRDLGFRDSVRLTSFGYMEVSGLGALACLLNPYADSGLTEHCREAWLRETEHLRRLSQKSGWGAAMEEQMYFWGSNGIMLQRGALLALTDRLLGEEENLPYARAQADVLMGRNPLAFSYVSGVGEHCMKHPHLRPTMADGMDECIPGMVSGGPNRHRQDEAAREQIPEGTPPMCCYIDNEYSYSTNEITIYWNSPAVMLMAYLTSKEKANI